jgi:hypothetical protein
LDHHCPDLGVQRVPEDGHAEYYSKENEVENEEDDGYIVQVCVPEWDDME